MNSPFKPLVFRKEIYNDYAEFFHRKLSLPGVFWGTIISVLAFMFMMQTAAAYGSYSGTSFSLGISIPPGTETMYSETNLTYPYFGQQYYTSFYLKIPKRVDVSSATMLFTPYQDYKFDTNMTTVEVNGTWAYASANFYDDSWSTYARCSSGDDDCYIRFNYTKEAKAVGAIWEIAGNVPSPSVYLAYRENISLADDHPDCYSQDPLQLMVQSDEKYSGGDQYENSWFCWDGSSWDLVHESEGASSTAGAIFEEAIHWIFWPENVTVDVGDNGQDDYVNDTVFNTSETIDLNISYINDYLHNDCTSEWDENCYIEVQVLIDMVPYDPATIEVSNLVINGTYIDTIGNCSEDYYTQDTMNFTFIEETTNGFMNGSAEYAITANDNSTYNASVTNVTSFTICALDGLDITIDAHIEYDGSDYPKRNYFMDDATVNASIASIYLYLLDDITATNTLFTVRDTYQNLQSDIIIYAQRYFPASDDYITVAMGKTGPEGTTTMELKQDVWYKYILLQSGDVLEIYSPQQLTDDTVDLFYTEGIDISFFNYYGDVATSCYYNETSMYLICTFVDTSGKLQLMNLTVTERFLNGSAWTLLCNDSSTSVSGTLSCDLSAYQNRTVYYRLLGGQCCSTYTWYTWEFALLELGTASFDIVGNVGLTGVLVAGLLFLTIAAVGFYNPRIAIVMALVGFMFISPVMRILPVDWPTAGGILVVGVFLVYVMGGRNVKSQ